MMVRAPVMVALMYIEAGMPSIDAVALLKDRRKGSLNNKQVTHNMSRCSIRTVLISLCHRSTF